MSPRVVSYVEVVAVARLQFTRRGTVDMNALATELAVSRATLYRVADGRDRLLGDVLWSIHDSTITRALAISTESGIDRIIEAWQCLMMAVSEWPPFLRFLADEPGVAHRALFTPNGAVHTRAVSRWTDLLQVAHDSNEIALPYPAADAAHLLVVVAEVVVYKDLFAGRRPDLALAAAAQRALLLGPGRQA